MSSNLSYFNVNNFEISSIKDSYLNFKEEELNPINKNNYTLSLETRKNMLDWLSFLCKTLNFTNQTLFRVVSIFDQYISKITKKKIEEMSQEKLNLITIACLSLSTKLEENNCNYIAFLNEKVLNSPNKIIFTNKDLTKMEFEILKVLKYKLLYSTPLDFIDIYMEIFSNFIKKNEFIIVPEILSNIRTISINIMKNNINSNTYFLNTSSHFAYLCFIQALNQISIIYSLSFKQLEKIILTFNYQFENIF